MSRGRLTVVVVAAALWLCTGCGGGHGGGGNPASPSGSGSASFTADNGVRFGGSHPAPVVVNGVTYVYTNTGTDGTQAQAASDGLNFALTAAAFPAGISRTIVALPGGRYRMYYFADATTTDVSSAISSDGLKWTVEDGIRYSDPQIGAIRAMVLPTGGYRLYYPGASGINSASSSDGLSFAAEGPVSMPSSDTASTWGPSAAVYVKGEYHMVLTKVPASGISELWHAVSSDGRNWTLDKGVLAANPGVPLNQPAWSVNGGIMRIYFRAQPSGGGNSIGSGIISF